MLCLPARVLTRLGAVFNSLRQYLSAECNKLSGTPMATTPDLDRLAERIARNEGKIDALAGIRPPDGRSAHEIDERIDRHERVKSIQVRLLGLLTADGAN